MSNPRWTRDALSLSLGPFLWTFLIFAGFVSSGTPAFSQATNFAIGTTVQQPSVKRLGIDLGGQNYWDSGQMMRNLIFNNPGFEGETWQTVIQCAAATATSCTDADPWTAWVANFWAGGTIEVISGAGNGETTTISANGISAYAAGNTSNPNYGATLNFSALSTPIAAGDWIIARIPIPGNPQNGWWTSTQGGATISTDLTDIAPDSPGKQALEMSASGSGQSASVTSYWDSSGNRQYVQMNGTYTIVFKAKSLGGSNVLNVNAARVATPHGNEVFFNQNVTLTNQWQDYSYTFTANEDGTYTGTANLSLSLSGGSAYIDDVALTEAAAPDNPTAFRNAVVDTLRQLKPGVIRYMTGTDFGASTADIVAPPFARQPAGVNGTDGTPDATQVSMGLEEFLVLCQAVGAEPWYTMAGGATVQDMQNLVEFLGGSTSTPYGAIRASLGQAAPWTTVFPKIHIELGNEMWNYSMVGEMMGNAAVYGARAGKLFTAAKASPSYSPNLDLIMGSWAVVPSWTQGEMAAGSNYDSVDGAPYLFYSLSDYSSNEAIFGPMFAQPEQIDETSSPSGNYMAQQAATVSTGPAPANLEVYEVNLSTVSGTAPQDTVNQVVAGVGAGVAVADHMLLMMRDDGILTQNMFELGGIENGFTNTATGASETTPLWGSVIDMGGETNVQRPQFLAEQLVNNAILPTMLATTVTGTNPTWIQPLSANDTITPIQLPVAHYLQSFAFTDGTHYSVIVINLSRSGSLPVTFSGTHAPTGNVLVSQLTSLNPTDNNEGLTSDAPVVSPTQTDVSNFNPATPYSLPPFSITTFTWPGSTLPASTTTLSANPTSGSLGQNVTLTATVTSQGGSTTPGGTVTFMDGSTSLGTGTLSSSGVATLSTASLPAGANSITASYGGDSNDAGSTSSAVTVTLTGTAVATTTTLSASPTSAATGQNVTFTATVAPASGTVVPAGTVTFLNGSATLGTGTLNASGVATFSTTTLTAGTDSITASYGGSTSNSSSISPVVKVNVTQTVIATKTALISSASQITPGESVTFTATVSPQSGTTAPSGTVTFLSGTTTLGAETLNSNGTASFSTTTLAAGNNSITASYAGNAGNSASVSTAVTVNVSQSIVSTTTSMTSSATQVNTGQNVTFTAKVAAQSGTATPAGSVSFMNGSTILGTATLNSSGVASFSTTTLPAGSDPITSSYGGSTAFGSSVSAAVTVTVTQTQVATTTTLAASATQINAGQSVSFTATVVPQTGSTAPGGTVTFLNGGSAIGTATLNASGVASFSTTGLAVGSDLITASYGGSTAFSSSVSTATTVTVTQTQIATTTMLIASPTQINTGQSVTFTATVAPPSGTAVPSGAVTFLNGGTVVGTATLNGSGSATVSTSTLPAGTLSITASYGGSASNSSSTSAAVVVTVKQSVVATTTTLVASATQITAGQNVTFTATVAPQSGATPTGAVTFLDGSVTLGAGTLSQGAASFSTAALTAGTHSITASYGASASNSASVSAAVSITVAPAPVETITALSASATAVNTGQGVTFTATVTPKTGGGNVPLLPVAFLNGSSIIGTANVNASGVATFTTTSLPAGADSITASYTGNTSDLSSVSNAVLVTVTQTVVATATTLTASATQIDTGQSVTFTATVAPQSGSKTPTGTVTFLDGGIPLGTGTLNASGVAFFATASLAAGPQTITASYGGDTADQTSASPAVLVTVTQSAVATTTSLSASASQINSGGSVTFTAKVTAQSGSTIPAGTVAFLNGSAIIGSGTLSSGGIATFTTTALPVGADSITASYGGNSASGSSISPVVTVSVTQSVVPTSTALTSSATQINSGQNVVFTAVVTPQSGSATPTGTVTFLDGSATLGTAALGSGGTAFFATSGLGVGTHSISASYGGNTSNAKSASSVVTVTVAQTITATTTILTGSSSETGFGQGVTFTAVVTPQAGSTIPGGTVSFLDGSTILGTGTLDASGRAYFGSTTLALGTHSISASYSGSSSNSSSISSPFAVIVIGSPASPQVPTLTGLTASTSQATSGQNVTLTANVNEQSGNAVQTGTVTFFNEGQAFAASMLTNGVAVLNTSSLPAGANSIVAVYGGGPSDLGSTSVAVSIIISAATITQGPSQPPPSQPPPNQPPATPAAPGATASTLTASASQLNVGQPVTLSVTVAGAGPTPTGTVTFLDGQTALGMETLNGGVASFINSSLALGAHSITASYSGDASNAASISAAVAVTVASAGTPSYTMAVSTSDVTVTRGQLANLTVTLTPENGFNTPVDLTCSGAPAGTTCSFNPATVTPNGAPVSSTLSISVAPATTTTTTAAQNIAPRTSSRGMLALGLVMPWGMLSLLGLSRRKNRSRIAGWSIRVAIAAALVAGSLWMSGCGYKANGSVFTMTLTSSGANVPTHTSQITVNIMQ